MLYGKHPVMKRLLLIFFLLPGGYLSAQTDSAVVVRDTIHTKRDMPDAQSVYNSELPKDIGPPKDSVLVTGKQVPRRVRKALNENEIYDGWQDGEIYLNRNTGLYMLYLTRGNLINKFGLDVDGKQVTYISFKKPNP
jgi:hypothetical protein